MEFNDSWKKGEQLKWEPLHECQVLIFFGLSSSLILKLGHSAGLFRAHTGLLNDRLHAADRCSVGTQIPHFQKNLSILRPLVTFLSALVFIFTHCEPSFQTPT